MEEKRRKKRREKKTKKKFVPVLTLLLLLPMFGVFTVFNVDVSKTSSTTIYVDPPTLTAPSSENFTVDINIEDVTDLFGWQAWLKWDPQLLDVVNATEGSFLKTGGTTTWYDMMNQSEGWIFIMCTFSDAILPGVSGSGTLANVKFHGASPGECVLDLYETKLFNSTPVSVSAPPYLGDVDGDLIVKIQDLAKVAKALGASEEHPSYDPNADFNNDGFVGLFDLLCVAFNWEREYPIEGGEALEPVEITHGVHDGYVTIYARTAYSVTWKWLDFPHENPVWLTVNVTVSSSYPIENFNFNRSLGQISFNFTSATPGFCNVTVPKLLMDGAFKVLINDTQVASILTWNKTHTSIYFTHDQGIQNVAIIGEIVTRIRSLDLRYLIDINGDGVINISDQAAISRRFGWKEDG